MSRHPKGIDAETMNFDYATVKSTTGDESLLVGGGPRGETFARRVPRNGAKFDDLERFLEVMKQLRPYLVHERPGRVLGADDTAGSLEAGFAYRVLTD